MTFDCWTGLLAKNVETIMNRKHCTVFKRNVWYAVNFHAIVCVIINNWKIIEADSQKGAPTTAYFVIA